MKGTKIQLNNQNISTLTSLTLSNYPGYIYPITPLTPPLLPMNFLRSGYKSKDYKSLLPLLPTLSII